MEPIGLRRSSGERWTLELGLELDLERVELTLTISGGGANLKRLQPGPLGPEGTSDDITHAIGSPVFCTTWSYKRRVSAKDRDYQKRTWKCSVTIVRSVSSVPKERRPPSGLESTSKNGAVSGSALLRRCIADTVRWPDATLGTRASLGLVFDRPGPPGPSPVDAVPNLRSTLLNFPPSPNRANVNVAGGELRLRGGVPPGCLSSASGVDYRTLRRSRKLENPRPPSRTHRLERSRSSALRPVPAPVPGLDTDGLRFVTRLFDTRVSSVSIYSAAQPSGSPCRPCYGRTASPLEAEGRGAMPTWSRPVSAASSCHVPVLAPPNATLRTRQNGEPRGRGLGGPGSSSYDADESVE
ncbi:hypothetical protein CMUS01_02016 [Colletotrichum musicola]|uniref:Uncharacterized protein n=1 Tax=Colletotrichum musicola TaxID=2175873 RepID=A0A8H6NW30_9PEZI|nr:hypothetical protein CMUS01_02016 [Colletotrichum musicola]